MRSPALSTFQTDVVLTHLRTELIGEHDLSLTEGGGVVPGFTGEGVGGQEPQLAKLSAIVVRDYIAQNVYTRLNEPEPPLPGL